MRTRSTVDMPGGQSLSLGSITSSSIVNVMLNLTSDVLPARVALSSACIVLNIASEDTIPWPARASKSLKVLVMLLVRLSPRRSGDDVGPSPLCEPEDGAPPSDIERLMKGGSVSRRVKAEAGCNAEHKERQRTKHEAMQGNAAPRNATQSNAAQCVLIRKAPCMTMPSHSMQY